MRLAILLVVLIGMWQPVRSGRLKTALGNGTGRIFVWTTDVLSGAVLNVACTSLYAVVTRQSSRAVLIINITNPKEFTSRIVNVNNQIDTIAGVLHSEKYAFTPSAQLFSLDGTTVLAANTLTAVKLVQPGPLYDSLVIIQDHQVSLYSFKESRGLVGLSTRTKDMAQYSIPKAWVVSARKDTLLYMIVYIDRNYYLQLFDYLTAEVTARVLLPADLGIFYTTVKLLLGPSEEYVGMYSSGRLNLYRASKGNLVTVGNLTLRLSTMAVMPNDDLIIAKDELADTLYVISMEQATIMDKMPIPDRDYFKSLFVRQLEGKTYVILTDYVSWYSYELESIEPAKQEALVNGYVILMSSILGVGMIVAIVYLLCKTKGDSGAPPPHPHPHSHQHQHQSQLSRPQLPVQAEIPESGHQLSVPRTGVGQVSAPRTMETHVVTDLNESQTTMAFNRDTVFRRLLACPLTGLQLKDPVVAHDGFTYEREAIEQWFQQNDISPVTQLALHDKTLIPNKAIASYLSRHADPSS